MPSTASSHRAVAPPPAFALLSTRGFVRDMALLAEGCVMADMHTADRSRRNLAGRRAPRRTAHWRPARADPSVSPNVLRSAPVGRGSFWDFEDDAPPGSAAEVSLRLNMESRERYPFWAPDKVGELSMRPVRF